MLPEYRIAGILNASAQERDERIQNMIDDVAQSSNVTQDITAHIEEAARHWEKNEAGAGSSARSRDPAKSLLQSMTKFWPNHAQEVVASMLNHATEINPGESFYNGDVKNSIRSILVRQEHDKQEFDLDTLISQTKSSELCNIKRSLEAIRNSGDSNSTAMRDFAGDMLEEHFGVEKRTAEVVPIITEEEPPTNG